MKLAILITTRNHPQRIEQLLRRIESSVTIPHDVFVAECGPDAHEFDKVTLIRMEDIGHRDDCTGLTLALEAARKAGRHDYYWILTEEVSFDADVDVVLGLIDRLERERLMAIAAPTWNQVGFSPRPDPTTPDGWHAVASCELRGYVMKADAIEDVGFLNTEFVYGVGAMHELCHRLYSAGWFVARCEDVILRLNSATVLERKADSALEHYARACRFAYEWFRTHHGEEWDAKFWSVTRGLGVDENPFVADKTHWARCFDQQASESAAPAAPAPRRAPAAAPPARAPAAAPAAHAAPAAPAAAARSETAPRAVIARLNLGSGSDYRPGWINVDLDPISGADLIAHAESLPMFASGSIDVIEARQLLPYLGCYEAQGALREWARLLRPGGELLLELPDLEACVAAIGRHADERGLDPALTGLYGEPRQGNGSAATYRWAWSRSSLTAALREAGFDSVQFEATNRCQGVAGFARDMRTKAKRSQTPVRITPRVEQVAPATPAPQPAGKEQRVTGALPAGAVDISAWPIATDAALRIFAWPDYDHAAEIELLFNVYGRHLIGRRDVCLVLRQDKKKDGSSSFVRAKLELAHGRSVGHDAEIDVLLIDEDLTDADWPRLGRSVDCALLLPSSHGRRRELLTALGVPLVENADQLLLHLPEQVTP